MTTLSPRRTPASASGDEHARVELDQLLDRVLDHPLWAPLWTYADGAALKHGMQQWCEVISDRPLNVTLAAANPYAGIFFTLSDPDGVEVAECRRLIGSGEPAIDAVDRQYQRTARGLVARIQGPELSREAAQCHLSSLRGILSHERDLLRSPERGRDMFLRGLTRAHSHPDLAELAELADGWTGPLDDLATAWALTR